MTKRLSFRGDYNVVMLESKVWGGGHSFKEQNFEDMIEIIAQR